VLFAATVKVTERSEPAGIVSRSTFIETATEHLTMTAPLDSTGYRFTHWTLNGVRQADVLGQAVNPVRFTVYEVIDAVARYVPVGQDTVGDGIPDWWRLRYYGNLNETADSDADGDGLTLAEEYFFDTNPLISEIYVYAELSEPTGFVKRSVVVSNLMSVTSQALGSETQGCAFVCWEVGGVRQADSLGMSMSLFAMQITNHTVAVARYLSVSQDTVGDGIPDWWRLRYYGDLNAVTNSDADGDGLTLAEEYRYDFNPVISNTVMSGGVSMRNSELVTVLINSDFHVYTERSEPGGLVERSLVLSNLTMVTSQTLGSEIQGYGFAYWEVGGVRQTDGLGMSLGSFTMQITNHTVAVARYLPVSQSTVGDGIPDWWRLRYYGNLNEAGDSDADGDDLTLAEEYLFDTNPLIQNLCVYSELSEPTGLVDRSVEVTYMAMVTSQVLGSETQGCAFAYWDVGSVRQADSLGMSLSRFTMPITSNTVAVARYLPVSQDTVGDGIPDWWRLRYYGDLNAVTNSDSEGDGLTLAEEYRYDFNPVISNTVMSGGVSMRNSELVTMDLQPFERVEYVQWGGILTNAFNVWPTNVFGRNFGINCAPAVGDWDGDGDLDVFVGSSGGVMGVYENVGSRRSMNLSDRSSSFGDLSSRWSGIMNPYPALADWDGNGTADLAVGGSVGVMRLISSTVNFVGSHTPAVDYTIDTGSASAIPAFAEVTGDGRPDLLVLLGDGTVRAYCNTGISAVPYDAGNSTNNILGTTVPSATGISGADINGDGLDDILVSDIYGRIWNFLQGANGTFVLNSRVWAGTGVGFADRLSLTCGDLDGDGDVDALCGYALGGIMFLRDPSIGIPSGLRAYDGATSILLSWEPSVHYRFRGFYTYRSLISSGAWSRITGTMLPTPEYKDTNVTAGLSYYYHVTALGSAMYPGNSSEILVETKPSETVSAKRGKVVLWMSDYNAQTGTVATLKVNAYHASGVAGQNMDIRILYDPLVIRPVSQIISTNVTVELTSVSQGLTTTNNGLTANGELRITGTAGMLMGEGHIFDVKFFVNGGATAGKVTTNSYSYAYLEGQSGVPLEVDCSSNAVLTVTGTYVFGDVDGDGVVDHKDCVALQQIVAQRLKPSASVLKAGDMDGNGYLDHNDFKLLHALHVRNK
jgi:hypothetical protein